MLLTQTTIKSILFGIVTLLCIIPIIMICFYNRIEGKPIKLHSGEKAVKVTNENVINPKSGVQFDLKNQHSSSTVPNNQETPETEGGVKERSSTFNKINIKKNPLNKTSFENNNPTQDSYGTSYQPGSKSKKNDQPGCKKNDFYHPKSAFNQNNSTQGNHSDINESESKSNESYQSDENDPTHDIYDESNESESKSNESYQSNEKDLTHDIHDESNESESISKENDQPGSTSKENDQSGSKINQTDESGSQSNENDQSGSTSNENDQPESKMKENDNSGSQSKENDQPKNKMNENNESGSQSKENDQPESKMNENDESGSQSNENDQSGSTSNENDQPESKMNENNESGSQSNENDQPESKMNENNESGSQSKENDQSDSKISENDESGSQSNENDFIQDIHSENNQLENSLNESYQSESKSYENDPTQDISIKSNELESKSNKNDQQGSKSNNNFQSKSYFNQNTSTQDIQSNSNESEKNYNKNNLSEINSSEKEQSENISNINDVINLGSTQIVLYDEEKDSIKQVKDCLKNLPNNKNDDNIINSESVPKGSETASYTNIDEISNCINSKENGNMIYVNVPISNTIFSSNRAISINENEKNKILNQDETLENIVERKFDCSSCQVVNEHDAEETLSKKEELVMINLKDSAADMTNHSCSITKSDINSMDISTEAEIPESSCLKGLLPTKKGKNSQGEYKVEGENEVSFSMEKLYKSKEMQKNVTNEDNLSGMHDPKKSTPLIILTDKNKSKEERFKSIEIQAEKNKLLATEETIQENVFEIADNIEFNGEFDDCYCVATETIHVDKTVLDSKKSTEIKKQTTTSNENSNNAENYQALISDENFQASKSNVNGQNLQSFGNWLNFRSRRDVEKSQSRVNDQDSKLVGLSGQSLHNTHKKNPSSFEDFLQNQKFQYNSIEDFESSIRENPIEMNKIIYAFRNILGDLSMFYNNDKSKAFDFIDTKIADKNLNIVKCKGLFNFNLIRIKYEKSYKKLNTKEIQQTIYTRYLNFDEYFLQVLTTHLRLSSLFFTSPTEFGNFMSCIKNNEFVLFELIYSLYSVNINKKIDYAQLARNAESILIQFFCGTFDFDVPSCVNLIYYVEAQILFKIMKNNDRAMAFKSKFLELLNQTTEL